MNDDYRDRLEDLIARLPARNLGPRRSATPAEEEPAQEETPTPRRTVSRVHASAVGVLLVVVLSVIAVWLMRSKPTEVPAGAVMVSTVPEGTTMPGRETTESEASSESTTPAALPVATTTPAVGAPIQVHVAGRVKHPGVYTVNPNARVADAIEAAGGMTAGAHPGRLNLAAPVCDGCQVWIPVGGDGAVTPPDQSAGGPAGAVGGSGRSSGVAAASGSDKAPVNLNTANQSELETIDGVGPEDHGLASGTRTVRLGRPITGDFWDRGKDVREDQAACHHLNLTVMTINARLFRPPMCAWSRWPSRHVGWLLSVSAVIAG